MDSQNPRNPRLQRKEWLRNQQIAADGGCESTICASRCALEFRSLARSTDQVKWAGLVIALIRLSSGPKQWNSPKLVIARTLFAKTWDANIFPIASLATGRRCPPFVCPN